MYGILAPTDVGGYEVLTVAHLFFTYCKTGIRKLRYLKRLIHNKGPTRTP